MQALVAQRIKSARIRAGLSMRELSDQINGIVSHTAISKYEKAQNMPDSTVLTALANALGVKTDYFYRTHNVSLEKVEFRKRSKLGIKKVKSIKEEVIETIERYLQVEEFLGINTVFKNPLKKRHIQDGNDVEDAVLTLLKSWNLGYNALPNIIDLLEDKEIKVIELDADEAFDGLSGWANSKIPIVVVNKNFPIERKRFTALHELGHLLMQFDEGLTDKEIERFCHQFAGAMLIPKPTFIQELGELRSSIAIPELVNLKETYGVSIQAIMARAKHLGIISNDRYVRFRKWINRTGNRKEEGLGEYKGIESSNRFNQLIYRAAAEEIISLSKAASLANVKLAKFRDDFVAI